MPMMQKINQLCKSQLKIWIKYRHQKGECAVRNHAQSQEETLDYRIKFVQSCNSKFIEIFCYKQHNLLDNLPLVQKMNKVNSTSVVIVDFGKMSQCRKSLFWQSSNSSKKLLCFSYGMQLSKMIMSFIFEIN